MDMLRNLGMGMALVTAIGVAGCAGTVVDEGTVDEAALALDPLPPLPPGAIAICTVSGATETGREWAALVPARHEGLAFRMRLGGAAPTYYRSCYAIAR